VIEARDLRYTYPDGTAGLDGVDVTVAAGERVAVLGTNGSGKSTLQLVLGGLEAPDGGRVTYFGDEDDPEAVRERLGVLLQHPEDYLFNSTVREDVEYGPAQFDVPRDVAEERVENLRDVLALDGLLDRPPFRLSAGEQQRAALAAVLAADPDLVLLDEPTSRLDGDSRERVLGFLDSLAADGRTLVTFTPRAAVIPHVADRVLLLDEGSVVARGSTREIVGDADLLADLGLRAPPAVRLFDGLDGFDGEAPLTIPAARDRLECLAEGSLNSI